MVDQNLELEQSDWVDSKTSNLSKGSHNKDFDEEEGDKQYSKVSGEDKVDDLDAAEAGEKNAKGGEWAERL